MAHVILFDQSFLGGGHRHVLDDEPDLEQADALDTSFVGPVWSFVILEGNWELFRGPRYSSAYPDIYGPGLYEFANDDATAGNPIGSLRPSTAEATQFGETPDACVTLFEHAGFRGDHRHVFNGLTDLAAPCFDFAGSAASLVVTPWAGDPAADVAVTLYAGSGFSGEQRTIGAGAIACLSDWGPPIDSPASLQVRVTGRGNAPTGDQSLGEIILFEETSFHGRHRHVYLAEPDLGAPEDSAFANNVSSYAVLSGAWLFCSQPDFHEVTPAWNLNALRTVDPVWPSVQPPPYQLPGRCADVATAGMSPHAIMSLHPPLPDIYFRQTPAVRGGQEAWWIVFVAGRHPVGGLRMRCPAINLDATDLTPESLYFHHLTDYLDDQGETWASIYCTLRWMPISESIEVEASCRTEGAHGASSEISNRSYWANRRSTAARPAAATSDH